MHAERPRVLFVSHDASRTGAPKALLPILGAVKGQFERVVAVKHLGPLLSEFETRCEHLLLEPGRGTLRLIRRGGASVKASTGSQSSSLLRIGRRVLVAAETRVAAHLLDEVKPNLVYINSLGAAEFIKPAAVRQIPTILHVHEIGDRADELVERYSLNLHAAKLQVVACSKAAARHLELPSATVIPNTVDPDQLKLQARSGTVAVDADGPIVASVGTVGRWKGSDLFVKAAQLVLQAEPTARFVWVGTGPDLHDMKARSPASVTFTGELENPYATVANAEVIVVSSRVESFGLAAAEAMALGVPVAGFDVGGLSEVLGDSGVLVEPEDVEALASAIISLLRDPARRRELASRAEDRVRKRFAPAMISPLIAEVIERALKTRSNLN